MAVAETFQTITPEELGQRTRTGGAVDIIDVRTPAEFREVHASVARNVPLDRLDCEQVFSTRQAPAGEPLYVICRSGSRGRQACEKFVKSGYSNVVNVEGGTQAWEATGLPVVRGKKTISLERQVRIAAGLLVLTGALLAFFVNINFVWLSAFVGAGLTFAGITDTCGMGMLLARMPWNQVATECSVSAGSKPSCSS
ncbi:Inner membrane protein YgaP [Maioricimonas rarisocia]|uniref:Inner membrane protein YgaP n=1 Tax=Maioricimonas rarisocia TaxID=2528026 RepID=A0A517ZA41_9PLAN|nr:rhodanese-like domain-containing protein [Maioricimonas rarisocia]QDU39354.1 Inner membrane protein YgaP [Maioricimonas rarisocia]